MNDTTGEGGDELVEIMAGTFIICGFNPDSGEDTSLTPQQAEHWIRRFHEPETFVQTMDGSIHAIPIHQTTHHNPEKPGFERRKPASEPR